MSESAINCTPQVEDSMIANLAGELIDKFSGSATASEIAGCHKAARLCCDLDRQLLILQPLWNAGDDVEFERLAKPYLKASADLLDTLFYLGGHRRLFDRTDAQDRCAMHCAVADNILLNLHEERA